MAAESRLGALVEQHQGRSAAPCCAGAAPEARAPLVVLAGAVSARYATGKASVLNRDRVHCCCPAQLAPGTRWLTASRAGPAAAVMELKLGPETPR